MNSRSYVNHQYTGTPFSVLLTGKGLSRFLNAKRYRDTEHGREYQCNRCDTWLPFDSEFFSVRTVSGDLRIHKVCRVCEREVSGRDSGSRLCS